LPAAVEAGLDLARNGHSIEFRVSAAQHASIPRLVQTAPAPARLGMERLVDVADKMNQVTQRLGAGQRCARVEHFAGIARNRRSNTAISTGCVILLRGIGIRGTRAGRQVHVVIGRGRAVANLIGPVGDCCHGWQPARGAGGGGGVAGIAGENVIHLSPHRGAQMRQSDQRHDLMPPASPSPGAGGRQQHDQQQHCLAKVYVFIIINKHIY